MSAVAPSYAAAVSSVTEVVHTAPSYAAAVSSVTEVVHTAPSYAAAVSSVKIKTYLTLTVTPQ